MKHLKSKLKYLFDKDYAIDEEETFDKLYDRVKSGSMLLTDGPKMSIFEEEKMRQLYKSYSILYGKVAAFEGKSEPSIFRLPR